MTELRLTRSAAWMLILGALVSLSAVWLVARDVDWTQFRQALAVTDRLWILLGIAAVGATFIVRTWRWALLLRPVRCGGVTILTALLVGQTLNLLLPLRAGDIARSVALGRAPGSSFERVLGSVAVEKVWDWLSLTGLAFLIALAVPLPEWFVAPARAVGLVAVFLTAGLGLVLTQRQRSLRLLHRLTGHAPFRLRMFMLERLTRFLDGIESLQRSEIMWRVGLLSALTWLLGVLANVAVMRAFGVQSWPAAMFLMAVLMVGVTLPPSIAALGVFEALTVLALGAFQVPRETALAIGVTLHAIVFILPIVVVTLLLGWENRLARPSPATARAPADGALHD